MTEQPYDAESVLQELIASHPEMLVGDEAGHGRLLFVRREAGVSELEDAGARWSLDHLYLDSQGVPTLVEVKRSRRQLSPEDRRASDWSETPAAPLRDELIGGRPPVRFGARMRGCPRAASAISGRRSGARLDVVLALR